MQQVCDRRVALQSSSRYKAAFASLGSAWWWLHSQKRNRLAASWGFNRLAASWGFNRLAASWGFNRLAASCQQVASSLLTSWSFSKSVKVRLVATGIWYLQTCCKSLKQLVDKISWQSTCSNPVDNLQQTCYHQAMQTYPNIGLITARQ